ncbi:CDP-alcohol phosphatidyltransferase family protein [Sansalvadorimonas sp. 2012CJ34-2]|uniref:CDP-alcohol phosphatidyltransferase family protein n=1 Tax=Parendozoicomonas callyspongiae TaxID=2942213 RepID=A0ABT0PJ92_9GAMM|nr:CDP-alcohol phosphatidyltransferase family protein [Sansalvadorimonas sp. 2012CJ34-2]MCL6271428.1 CDP-alcohol phosphatidyltransferase family protein [Sansalvadorimonas sp. 2012CJ34-2]
MLDRWTHAWVQNPLKLTAQNLPDSITPDKLTFTGFLIGLLSVPFLVLEWYIPVLIAVLLNRIIDGLDGALARHRGTTDAGGFLDITLDFVFYSAVIFGFALANPEQNALAAAFLLFSFMGTGSSFLAFAIMAEKHQIDRIQFESKSLHYMGGIAEGTETLLFYVAICLWPNLFPELAWFFGTLCFVTTATRIYGGYQTLSRLISK